MISASLVLYKNDKKEIHTLLSQLNLPCHIIDNSPTNALKPICDTFPQATYTHKEKNIGFGKAHNEAFKTLEQKKKLGKYHLILNPDIEFKANILNPLASYLETHDTTGLICPKILNPNHTLQPQCRLLPSPQDMIKRRVLKQERLKHFNYLHELHVSGYNQIFSVPFIQGSFWLIRSDLYKHLKGFDERFFLYMEDVDFCRRLHEKSDILFYPHVHVTHKWQKGSNKNFKLFALHVISMVKYFNKWGWFFDTKKEKLNQKTLKQFYKDTIATP